MFSKAGESWKPFYAQDTLSWHDPSRIDAAAVLRHARSEWITRLLRYAPIAPNGATRILEAGCGTAMFGISLAMLGYRVDAFDYNHGALHFARALENLVRQAQPKLAVKLYQDDLLNIHAPANRYDLVFNQAVLEYFCDANERRRALAEMVRVARPGGCVAVIVQHTQHPFRRAWERLGWPGYVDQPPVVDYSPQILGEELRTAGLSRIRIDGVYPWKSFFYWPRWYPANRWTHDFAYLLGQGLNRLVPVPRVLRSQLATQILGVGFKQ